MNKFKIITITFLIALAIFSSCKKDEEEDEPNTNTNESSFDFIDLEEHLDGSFKVIFLNENEGWVLGIKDSELISTTSTLIYTDDGGSTWTTMNTEIPGVVRSSIKFINSTDGWLIGDSDYSVYYTTDKGLTWTEMVIPNPDNYSLNFYATASNSTTTALIARVDNTSSTLYFISNDTHEITNTVVINDMKYPGHDMHLSEDGAITIAAIERTGNDFKEIAYSADNGASWTYTEIVTEGDIQGYTFNSNIAFPDDNTGYFTASDNAFIYKTSNGGATWAKITISPSVSHYNFDQIDFADANNGLGVDGTDIYKTTDGGETWIELSYFGDNYITTSTVSYPILNHGFLCSINGATDGSDGLYKYTGQ